MPDRPELWTCPHCARTFANRNQTHSCAALGDLGRHFRGKAPAIRALFELFVERLRACGPFEVLPQKSRIAFHRRMSFAQLTPKQGWIDGHLVLAEPMPHPMVRRIVRYSPRNHVHEFRLAGPADLDDPGFLALLAAAYVVGEQKHLD